MEATNWFSILCIGAAVAIPVFMFVKYVIDTAAIRKGHAKGLQEGFEKGFHEEYRKGFLKGYGKGCEYEQAKVVQSLSGKETLDRIENEVILHIADLSAKTGL
jgi:flagellar biosynthesis/type III secretory pathway protein FliH